MPDSGRNRVGSQQRSWQAVRVLAVVLVMLALSLPAAAGSGRVKRRDSAIDFTNDLAKALSEEIIAELWSNGMVAHTSRSDVLAYP